MLPTAALDEEHGHHEHPTNADEEQYSIDGHEQEDTMHGAMDSEDTSMQQAR